MLDHFKFKVMWATLSKQPHTSNLFFEILKLIAF